MVGLVKVCFLADTGNLDGTLGGAELTMREFRLAAPEDVELVELPDAETVIVGNCTAFDRSLIEHLEGKRVVRYFNDVDPNSDPVLRQWFIDNATCLFTSPLHVKRFPYEVDGATVPPPIDLARFRPTRQVKKHTERKGAVAIGAYQNPGKGAMGLTEWARENGGLDVYGTGQFIPNANYLGPLDYTDVPKTLWQYETFVHLPTDLEPFGRAVVEAWAAGCQLVVNGNVGAVHWIQNEPEKLETAGEDFWRVVTGE